MEKLQPANLASDYVYLSFIRDPIKRLISYYRFARVTPTDNVTTQTAKRATFEQFVDFLAKERKRILINQQCRFLAGDSTTRDDIDIKFSNIELALSDPYIFVAPTEKCTEVVARVRSAIGVPETEIINSKESIQSESV